MESVSVTPSTSLRHDTDREQNSLSVCRDPVLINPREQMLQTKRTNNLYVFT